MNSQLNDRLKGSPPQNEAAILFMPKQTFLTLQVSDYSIRFDRAMRAGVLKWLSQRILFAYEKEFGTAKGTRWKSDGTFSLEKQWLLPTGKADSKSTACTLMIRQPDFLTESFIKKIYRETKMSSYHPLLEEIQQITAESCLCSQILHTGSAEELSKSLTVMDQYVQQHHYAYADEYLQEIDLVRDDQEKDRIERKILRRRVRENI